MLCVFSPLCSSVCVSERLLFSLFFLLYFRVVFSIRGQYRTGNRSQHFNLEIHAAHLIADLNVYVLFFSTLTLLNPIRRNYYFKRPYGEGSSVDACQEKHVNHELN